MVSETCCSKIFLFISKVRKKSVSDILCLKNLGFFTIPAPGMGIFPNLTAKTTVAKTVFPSNFSYPKVKARLRFKGRLVRHKPSPFIFTVGTATLRFKEIYLYKQRNWKGRKIKLERRWISKVVGDFTFSRKRKQLGSVHSQYSKKHCLS